MNNISDFPDRAIIEEEAGAWIIMLDSETEPSEQQRQAFKEWMSRSPAHREEVKNLAKFWGKMNILTELAVPQHIVPHNRKSRRQKQSSPFISNIAIAAYSLSLAVGIALWVQLAPSNSPQNGLYATAVGQQKTIQLRDGSTLQLNTNSQVRVDYTDQHRDIRLLQGEAHFVVAKKPQQTLPRRRRARPSASHRHRLCRLPQWRPTQRHRHRRASRTAVTATHL